MDYREINDSEILSYVRESSDEAKEIIYLKYKPLITNIAKRMFYTTPNLGLDLNDFIQEGMIGLNKALESFKESKDTTFYTYAKTIIERRLISVLLTAKRKKHQMLNEAVSLDFSLSDDFTLQDTIKSPNESPESKVISEEAEKELIKKIEKKLTPFESQVFNLKFNGFNYKEIASMLDKTPKAIDNALQRIKTKIK
jgi:RNA polymerase sporulation-specific sigma factor